MPLGSSNVELCIPKKSIVAADKVSGLANMHADGVLGLSPVGSDSFLADLLKDRQIEHKVFSLSLLHNTFTLGGFDRDRFADRQSSMVWLKVEHQNVGS